MSYTRPEDQYKIAKAPEMIKQIAEEAQRKKPICGLIKVQTYKHIIFNGHGHAGVLTHICTLSPNHKEEYPGSSCVCSCGMEFQGWK